jgi:hypothetical protein
MNATNFVSYIRVSTTEQGESGLGLEAQRQTVSEYLARESGKLLCEFVEVESGSRNDRAQLQAAIELCKRYKATLLIAKLDRLARNVAFISRLMEIAAFNRWYALAPLAPHPSRYESREINRVNLRNRDEFAYFRFRGWRLTQAF